MQASVPVQEIAPQPETAPQREQPRAEPRKAEEPRIDAKQLLNDSGLVMVETDRAKVQVQPQVVDEAPQPLGRPRRERPKAPPQDDQLVQVETRNK